MEKVYETEQVRDYTKQLCIILDDKYENEVLMT